MKSILAKIRRTSYLRGYERIALAWVLLFLISLLLTPHQIETYSTYSSSSYDRYLEQLKEDQDKRDALIGALTQAATTNPNSYAEDVKLAKSAKMDVDAVPDFRDEAKQIHFLGQAGLESMWPDAPKTAERLSNPVNAKLSSDNIPNLTGITQIFEKVLGDAEKMWSWYFAGMILTILAFTYIKLREKLIDKG